jgi:glyoxylase-like metal-dependent hydrolase (beta-lactamase superfamily II)
MTVIETNAAEGIHRVEDAYVNWYLVEEGAGLTIVDTAHPRSWRSLVEVLRRIGRGLGDVEAVVLTHGHFDHMGFARRAQRELGVPVWAPAGEPVVGHPWRYDHERGRLRYGLRHSAPRRVIASMVAAGALWARGIDGAREYAAGERLEVPGRPTVTATPGHTVGHCSLHFPSRGALVAGDALVTFNPYTGAHGPQIVSGAATANTEQALRSLDALAATGAETLLPGHGRAWREGAASAAALAREAGPS